MRLILVMGRKLGRAAVARVERSETRESHLSRLVARDFAPLNPSRYSARQLISLSRRVLACFFRKRTALRKAHIG
jgi:hypothetical protein